MVLRHHQFDGVSAASGVLMAEQQQTAPNACMHACMYACETKGDRQGGKKR